MLLSMSVDLQDVSPLSSVSQVYTFGSNKTEVTIIGNLHFLIFYCSLAIVLSYAARHLQLDQTVQLNRVLHWEFLCDRLNEAVDDQGVGLGLTQATAHQVEELVVTDLRDGRLVADLGLVLFDANGGIGIGASLLIEQERVTADTGLGVVRTPIDADQTAIRGSTSTLGDRLREDLGSGVRSKVGDLGSSIQMHTIAGECH